MGLVCCSRCPHLCVLCQLMKSEQVLKGSLSSFSGGWELRDKSHPVMFFPRKLPPAARVGLMLEHGSVTHQGRNSLMGQHPSEIHSQGWADPEPEIPTFPNLHVPTGTSPSSPPSPPSSLTSTTTTAPPLTSLGLLRTPQGTWPRDGWG